ncbi:class I lanthipeptide [Dyadobacter sediminis]|uniref:class I lanthipeptide n=1 Tax=Dyadobacter sediminis TaxID=1493691 RepID=UPI0016629330|nr:class I lanthipeptide [Dyadobacter sediminis]
MKKKSNKNRLSLDKEIVAHLNLEQLLSEQANAVQGGVTSFTACVSCYNTIYPSNCT